MNCELLWKGGLGLVLLSAMLSLGPRALAGEPLTEKQLEKKVREGPKLGLPPLLDFTEAKLERIYQARLKDADPELREALQKSQEAWRRFYEAERVVGAIEERGGSGEAVATMERRLYQLRMRIFQLSVSFDEGWPTIPKVTEPGEK